MNTCSQTQLLRYSRELDPGRPRSRVMETTPTDDVDEIRWTTWGLKIVTTSGKEHTVIGNIKIIEQPTYEH